ncbi:MAG: hypothetical protein KAI47_23305 [Deltaproteobacteria bacterium]|nr:hypothetical protein [Deltaproteobacteria bacterium]
MAFFLRLHTNRLHLAIMDKHDRGDEPLYAHFLGLWLLDPASCDYEQGDPPRAGSYRIEEREGRLLFTLTWVDAVGLDGHASFSGLPDGRHEDFDGGDLADALSVEAVSARELTSAAYYKGVERMTTQCQLDELGMAMRVLKLVRLPDGTRLLDTNVYRRAN